MKRISKKIMFLMTGIASVASFCYTPSMATDIMVYPAKGQTADKQRQDEQQCRQSAIDQSGVDPDTIASSTQTVNQQKDRKVVRGAAAGAAVGGLGGSLGGEFGKGAAAGAVVGGIAGGIKKRQQQPKNEATNQELEQQRQHLLNKFNRAYGACLEERGYTVKNDL